MTSLMSRPPPVSWYMHRFIVDQPSNSRFQCSMVDNGTVTKNGPFTPSASKRCSKKVTICTVLQRPISSARMHARLLYQHLSSQFNPSSWYSRNELPL